MSAGNLPYAPTFDHLIYVRVFEGCNLHCEHCFIPSNPKRMDLGQMEALVAEARRFAKPGQRLMLQWHGGEPTLFGAQWLRDAISAVEQAGPEFVWSHGIQTNLMTYDDDWAALYRDKFGGEVGISWDPVIRLLRRDRPETHAQYDKRFWGQVQRLLSDGLDPYMVITATRTLFEQFPRPLDLFQMLYARGLRRIHLERVTETGYARDNWGRLGLNNAEYSRQMSRFMRAYVQYQRQMQESDALPLQVSPFDGLLASAERLVTGAGGGYGCWSGSCDTRFHTMDASGYKRGCTAVTSEEDNPRARLALKLGLNLEESRVRRRVNCGTCAFRTICSSGCLALSYDDGSGECSGGWSLFDSARRLAEAEVARRKGSAKRGPDATDVPTASTNPSQNAEQPHLLA